MILITGGLGFIGSNFVINFSKLDTEKIIILDKFVYQSSRITLNKLKEMKNVEIINGDIGNKNLVSDLLEENTPRAIINFAAETHVDTSIKLPRKFLDTNVNGTFNLLETVLNYWTNNLSLNKKKFRFIHISTDEVFGSLKKNEPSFKEVSKYYPNNPYSASKASSEHFARAFYKTYGLPIIITNCSNNYGPFQQSEKLIPNTIKCALSNQSIPIYGNGLNIRDWLYVEDHCSAISLLLDKGIVGESYNIGGNNEISNIEIIDLICATLDELYPRVNKEPYKNLITFVNDRLGHDFRYSINAQKINNELSWKACKSLENGIAETVQWYVDHQDWFR
ncbi:dTDP-glucose 4,6-dehydratase [Alphaproteobacteria bacterium]|nr:dTDP-glucose 4,6-dehydratase [Alphaproteobacteria bacterium]